MDFYLFRWSFKRTANLFEFRPTDEAPLSREAWLRHALSRQFDFVHRKTEYAFVPELDRAEINSKFIVGWIAKQSSVQERLSPAEGLAPTEHTKWSAAFVIIDPTHHEDGQKVAIEAAAGMGKPAALAKSLVDALNDRPDAPFEGVVYPILEKGSFWAFVSDHDNRIKSLSFTLAAPNMFGGKEDLERELRELRDNENVSQVKATLTSDTTLNTQTERIREVVDYTEKGAGKLKARAEDGESFNSEEHVSSRTVNVEPHTNGNVREFIRQMGDLLGRIF